VRPAANATRSTRGWRSGRRRNVVVSAATPTDPEAERSPARQGRWPGARRRYSLRGCGALDHSEQYDDEEAGPCGENTPAALHRTGPRAW